MGFEGVPAHESSDPGREPHPDDSANELSRRNFLKIAAGGLAAGVELQMSGRGADATERAESPEYHAANVERLRDTIASARVRENIQFAKDRFGNAEGVVSN